MKQKQCKPAHFVILIILGVIIAICAFIPRFWRKPSDQRQPDESFEVGGTGGSNCFNVLKQMLMRRPQMSEVQAQKMIEELVCNITPDDMLFLIESIMKDKVPPELVGKIQGLNQCPLFNELKAQVLKDEFDRPINNNACIITDLLMDQLAVKFPKVVTKTPTKCVMGNLNMQSVTSPNAEYNGCVLDLQGDFGNDDISDAELATKLNELKMTLFTIYIMKNSDFLKTLIDQITEHMASVKQLNANSQIRTTNLTFLEENKQLAAIATSLLKEWQQKYQQSTTDLSNVTAELQHSNMNLVSNKKQTNVAPIRHVAV